MRETFGPGLGRGRETRAQRAGVAARQEAISEVIPGVFLMTND
jgi:hypothetical protein